jgi:ABC-2 type transport system permease protein
LDLGTAWLIARNSLRISFRYPANFLIWGVLPLLWLLPFIFTGIAFTGGTTSASYQTQTGYADFIPYIVLGWLVFTYVDSSIWGVGNTLRWYQFSGVLEPMFMIPAPRLSILLGAAIAEMITTSISTTILFSLCVIIFGLRFAATAILPVLLFLLLMILGFTGFAFALSGLILVFKDPSVLTEFIDTIIYILTPLHYSVSTLPLWAQPLSLVLPSTVALVGIREVVLAATGLPQLWFDILILLVLDAVFWIGGMLLFNLAERHTRMKGTLGEY